MIQCNNLHSAMTPSFTILPSLNFYPKNSIKIASNPRPRSYKLLKTSNLSSLTTPSRDRIIDFGRHKGRMLGSLPSTYLKWVSKNLRAGDYEEWARLSDDVLKDPIYKDRIEWEFAEKILNGDVLRLKYESGSTVDELLELSERFGWDNDDKLGWSRIDFGLLGTSKGGRIPRLGFESKGRVFEKMESGKKISTNGGKDGGVERRRARRERLKLRTKKIENDGKGGGKLGTSDENVIDSANKMSAMTVSGGNGDGSNLFPGRQSLLKKAVSHKKKIITTIPPLRPVGFVVMCHDTNPYCLWQEFIEGLLNTSIQKIGKLSQDNLIKYCSSIHDCDPYCAKHEFIDKLQQWNFSLQLHLNSVQQSTLMPSSSGYHTLLRFMFFSLLHTKNCRKCWCGVILLNFNDLKLAVDRAWIMDHNKCCNPYRIMECLITEFCCMQYITCLKMSGHTSTWHLAFTKLRFFTRIRRFLQIKSHVKQHEPSDVSYNKAKVADGSDQEGQKEEEMVVLQRSVKKLHFGSCQEKDVAAKDIKRLASESLNWRKLMAELGVVPPLVAMVGSEVVARRRLAVEALIELANGTYTNKALIMDAGILSKLPENVGDLEEETMHGFAQLMLSLSSLANSQFPVNSSIIIPFVISVLEADSSLETKESCIGTLYSLSNMLDNANTLASDKVLNILLGFASIKQTSEKALATLGNLVVTSMGRKTLESNPMVAKSLIEIMTWDDKPRSQELSAYVLMILAHQSSVQRLKMANAGIVPVLLQVSLLSSPLAQKRAMRLLQWFKEERQTRMRPHSGPQTQKFSAASPVNQRDVIEGKKIMKNMVKQSLYKNMESMARRANGDEGSSKLKYLVISSSSKSLPY